MGIIKHRGIAVATVITLIFSATACGDPKKGVAPVIQTQTQGQGQAQAEQNIVPGTTIYIQGQEPSNQVDDQALIEQKLYDTNVWVVPSNYNWSKTATSALNVKAIYNGAPGNELTIVELPQGTAGTVGYDHDLCVSDDELQITIDPTLLQRLHQDQGTSNHVLWENNVQPVDIDDCTADNDTGIVPVPVPGGTKKTLKPSPKKSTTIAPSKAAPVKPGTVTKPVNPVTPPKANPVKPAAPKVVTPPRRK